MKCTKFTPVTALAALILAAGRAALAQQPGQPAPADPAYAAIESAVFCARSECERLSSGLTNGVSVLGYRSLVEVRGGTNIWTKALQKAIDEHEVVVIPASGEPYYVDATLVVPSSRRIEAAGARIRLADGVRTILLRNANVKDGTLAPIPSGTRDDNITVVGGSWEDCQAARAGYGRSGTFHADRRGEKGDFYGVSTLFLFENCNHVTVRDATFANCGGFAVQAGGGDALVFERIRFADCHADGLHLSGNLSRVHCRDVRGKVGDDLVALNAYDWHNSSIDFGPQRFVLCEDLELVLKDGKGYPAIRIQPAKYRYANGSVVDCSISDVIFRRVRGIRTFKMYLQTPQYVVGWNDREWSAVGSGGNFYFDRLEVDLTEPIDNFGPYATSDPLRGHFGVFELGANLSSVTIRDSDITLHADRWPQTHLMTVGPKSAPYVTKRGNRMEIFDPYVSCTVGTVRVENVRLRGKVPDELVHAVEFKDVNGDGDSSGVGRVERLVAGFSSVETFTARVKGTGSFELVAESGDPLQLKIGLAWGGYTPNGTQRDEHEYVSYSKRCAATRDKSIRLPPYDVYSNCVVQISSRTPKIALNYYLLPNFNMSMGLYDHAAVQAFMPSWRRQYRLAPDREYDFLCVPDPRRDRTLLYLDGSIFGSLPGVRRFVSARSAAKGGAEIVATSLGSRRDAGDHYELPPQRDKANDLLRDGATLSVGTGPQVIAGVPVTVWAPEQSVDQARHRQTTATRTITYSPLYNRTPWATGPEFIQWTVPSRTWRRAHVLCAEIPCEGRVPTIGTTLGKFGNGCTVGNCATDFASLAGAETNANVKAVGTLAYRRDGREVRTPLYLVTIPLNASRLGVRGKNALTLDFEFIGAGASDMLPRSSVQIFGCTLEPTPFSYEIANPVRGNIFEQGTDRQVGGLDVIAHLDGVKMSYSWETYGPTNEVLDCGRETLAFEKAGERRHVEIDLTGYGVGWYGRDYTFYDADGAVASRHRSAFTVLAPDDREAGYESPYAAWPHLKGYHGANPDPIEQLEVMRKLGARKTWSTPLGSEAEMAKWKVTLSTAGQAFSNPPWIKRSPATVSNYIEKAIASIRAQKEKFPHVGVVQMLHETWGINVCSQVVNGVSGARRPYVGWTDDCVTNRDLYMAYTCTEYAKRLKKEFPDLRIMLANGSGSSERVAQLAEDGLDLALVDQLGIECKGFTSLPECGSNRESPAALWALRETGRCFGFSNLTVNACNEYVFRCEREIPRTADAETCLRMTGYAVRDYLISLAHGCDIISQGHLEDPADAYYDTNWGAGGLCTFYPFSYPKRMFTALAVLSRVLDKPVYRRSLPTGAGAAYALEFRRERAHADCALALWTPHYGVTMRVAYPAGTRVRRTDMFGREDTLVLDATGAAELAVGAAPCYLVADVPALSATVTATDPPVWPSGARVVTPVNAATVTAPKIGADWFDAGWKHVVKGRDPWGCPNPQVGTFAVRDVADAQFAEPVTELELVPTGKCPAIRWENAYLRLNRPYRFKRSETKALAIAVRGNGSFARVHLVLRDPANPDTPMWHVPAGDERGFIAFDGWQTMVAPIPGYKSFLCYPEYDGVDEVELVGIDCGSARQALDPIEMRPVVGNVRIGPVLTIPLEKAGSRQEFAPTSRSGRPRS